MLIPIFLVCPSVPLDLGAPSFPGPMRRRQSTRPHLTFPKVKRPGTACPYRQGYRRIKSRQKCDCCGGDPTEYSFFCGRCRVVTWCSEFCRARCWDYHSRFCRSLGPPFPVPSSVRAPKHPPNNCHNCRQAYAGTDRRCLFCSRFLCYRCSHLPESRGLCRTCQFLPGPLFADPLRFPIRTSTAPLPSPLVQGEWVFVPRHAPPALVVSARFASFLETSTTSSSAFVDLTPVSAPSLSSGSTTAVAAEAEDFPDISQPAVSAYGPCPLCHSDLPDLLARLVLNPNPSTADAQ
jgi:hypothetical protein